MRLDDLATRIGAAVEGDGGVDVVRCAPLEEAGPGDLTFLADPRLAPKVAATRAGAIVLGPKAPPSPVPVLRAPDAYVAFAKALEVLHPVARPAPGVHPTAVVAKSARLGPGSVVEALAVVAEDATVGARAWIGPHVVVGRGARIGDDFRAHSHAVVREGCRLGHRVTLQDGAVIGSDGFGFAKRADGSYQKVPQVGTAVLGDDVEVQANACVDRATLGETRVERGAKIDNLVQVGHNSVVGEDTVLCAQTGLAGSSILGKRVTLAGQVGVAGHMTVGDDVLGMAQCGIISDAEPGRVVAGTPAEDRTEWVRNAAALRRLPALLQEVRTLRRRVAALEGRGRESPRAKSP